MEPRINIQKSVPKEALHAAYALEGYVRKTGFDPKILHLVRMRASQINRCAYCLDMHSKDARAEGETEQRLYGLNAWREAPYYTDRERAALEWTESLTVISENQVPDELYQRVRQHFSEAELITLTLAVAQINTWNRLAISFRAPAGSYQREAAQTAQ